MLLTLLSVVTLPPFGAFVTSLVNDIITPLILNPALKAAKVERIAQLSWHGVCYGNFLSAIINFIFVGTALFFIIKRAMKKHRNKHIKKKKTATKKNQTNEVLHKK